LKLHLARPAVSVAAYPADGLIGREVPFGFGLMP
jgi:hypothetical protein